MKQIIVTGFQPFGPYLFNPVEESTRYFDSKKIDGFNISGLVLPCSYFGAFQILEEAISRINPYAIISTGLSSSVRGIRFETIGKNIMNGKYPDENGYSPNNVPIIPGGLPILNTNDDNLRLARILEKLNIPTEISKNADEFICNSLIYLTANYIQTHDLKTKNIFIHTPCTDELKSKIELEPNKITIPKKMLHRTIETIIKSI